MKTIILVSLLATTAFAAEPEDIVLTFFNDLLEGKIREAVDTITVTMDESSKKDQMNLKLRSNLESISRVFGELYGGELISEYEVGESLLAMSYLARYKAKPVRFEFVFYKPDDVWSLKKLKMTDIDEDDMVNMPRKKEGFENVEEKE